MSEAIEIEEKLYTVKIYNDEVPYTKKGLQFQQTGWHIEGDNITEWVAYYEVISDPELILEFKDSNADSWPIALHWQIIAKQIAVAPNVDIYYPFISIEYKGQLV